ncbi:branched-chain amino acid aminotransferase [bacterium]|nr:branched-chain amino acid aminotransferase [bacterium]
MLIYIDGKYIPAEDATISLFDGGYLYGDGLFETIRLYSGQPFDLDGHLNRLSTQLETLEFSWRPDLDSINNIITELTILNNLTDADSRCRITVSRGGSFDLLLPLQDLHEIKPTVSIFQIPLSDTISQMQKTGIAVTAMKSGFARGNFPGLKTLNYLPTVVALRAARKANCQEALLINSDNNVLEAATSNVFIISNNSLYTPPLDLGLLSGRTRSIVLTTASNIGLNCVEKSFDLSELLDADEVFLSGSVKEILPVIKVDGSVIGNGKPGEHTLRLAKKYRQGVLQSLGG